VGATIRMALASPTLRVDIVDGIAAMDMVREWGVSGVPTVVIDDRISVEGPARDDTLLDFLLHAGDDTNPLPAAASVPFSSCGRLG
jgi:predicted DsbA family dithiol-disulfide isomerase